MNPERIQIQHMEEQLWQRLKADYREDLERVVCDGLEPGDEPLVKGVFNYVLARMDIADFDLEEAE